MFPLPVTAFRNATLDDDELTALMEPVVVIAETVPAWTLLPTSMPVPAWISTSALLPDAGTRSEEIATAPFTALRVMARFVVVIWPAT